MKMAFVFYAEKILPNRHVKQRKLWFLTDENADGCDDYTISAAAAPAYASWSLRFLVLGAAHLRRHGCIFRRAFLLCLRVLKHTRQPIFFHIIPRKHYAIHGNVDTVR